MLKGKNDNIALIEMLYDRYEQRIYRIAYLVLKDSYQAEDAVSETFIKVIKNVRNIWTMDQKRMDSYITKLARNTAVDQYRKNKRETSRVVSVDAETDRDSDISHNPIEDMIAALGSSQLVREFVDLLPDKYRQVIICIVFHELSGRETALMLGIGEGTVRKRYERAKKILKKKLSTVKGYNEYGRVDTPNIEAPKSTLDDERTDTSIEVSSNEKGDAQIRRCL